MSTLLIPAVPQPRVKLLTAADLARLPTDLPSGAVRYELNEGRLVVMPPPGNVHGAVQSNIAFDLKGQGERKGHGKARTELGVILRRNPDRVVGADVAFITTASLPVRESPEGYLETIPEVIVEVASKNDVSAEVQGKVDEYLAAGVSLVIVADPPSRTLTLHRKSQPPVILGENEVLTLDPFIPGFRMPVKNAFLE